MIAIKSKDDRSKQKQFRSIEGRLMMMPSLMMTMMKTWMMVEENDDCLKKVKLSFPKSFTFFYFWLTHPTKTEGSQCVRLFDNPPQADKARWDQKDFQERTTCSHKRVGEPDYTTWICFGPLMPSVPCGLVKGIENVKCLGSNMFYHEMYAFR